MDGLKSEGLITKHVILLLQDIAPYLIHDCPYTVSKRWWTDFNSNYLLNRQYMSTTKRLSSELLLPFFQPATTKLFLLFLNKPMMNSSENVK